MKLYDQPYSHLLSQGRRYRLRLTFDRVLMAIDAAADPQLLDEHRTRLMLQLLVRPPRPVRKRRRQLLLKDVLALLQQDMRDADGPPLMSLTQDAPLIIAGFRQAYGIDLQRTDLPWATFRDLLSGLPGDTRFGEVVALRARPVPEPTRHNQREREQLLRAKASVAIELTEEQRRQSYRRSAAKTGRAILAWARAMQKGGTPHV